MKELTLREIQLRELQLLIKFAEFCDQNELRYSLCSGTLLGAVRHQGFIPWDDDIDVQMPRSDYNRFIELMKMEPCMTIVGYGITKKCDVKYAPFIRIQDTDTHVKAKYMDNKQNDHLWIDILPLDGIPDSEQNFKKVIKRQEILKYCVRRANARIGAGKSFIRKVFKLPIVLCCRLVGADWFAKKWTELATDLDFDTSEIVGVIGGNYYGVKEIMPKKEWCERERKSFENREFWCMGCWEEHLEKLYGDYMQFPPEEKRTGHHDFKAYLNL